MKVESYFKLLGVDENAQGIPLVDELDAARRKAERLYGKPLPTKLAHALQVLERDDVRVIYTGLLKMSNPRTQEILQAPEEHLDGVAQGELLTRHGKRTTIPLLAL